MRRFVGVVSLAVLVLSSATAIGAELDRARVAAIDRAATTFLALAKDVYRTGQAPRQSDPAIKPLLDIVFDTAPLVANGPIPYAQMPLLNDWTTRSVAVGSVYVLAGTGIPDFDHLQSIDEDQEQRIERNTIAFASEIGRYFDAEMQIEHAMADSVLAEKAVRPESFTSFEGRQRLETMRDGVKQTLTGVMTTFLTPGLDPAWSRARLAVLSRAAAAAARFLDGDDRIELRQVALEVAARLEHTELRTELLAVADLIWK